jgi:excisionase family DNA binding protein
MDHLPRRHVGPACVALVHVGTGHRLAPRPTGVVLGRCGSQTLHVVDGAGGDLADAMGEATAERSREPVTATQAMAQFQNFRGEEGIGGTRTMLSLKQVAAYMGFSEAGVRKLIAKRKLRYFQTGKHGRIKFRPEWLDEYVAKNTIAPADECPPPPVRRRKRLQQTIRQTETDNILGFGWDLFKR